MTTLYISNITDDFLWSKVHDKLAGCHEDFISLVQAFNLHLQKKIAILLVFMLYLNHIIFTHRNQ